MRLDPSEDWKHFEVMMPDEVSMELYGLHAIPRSGEIVLFGDRDMDKCFKVTDVYHNTTEGVLLFVRPYGKKWWVG